MGSASGRRESGDPTPGLEHEVGVLCRYLLGVEPTAYVRATWIAAHRARPDLAARTPFDPLLLALASSAVVPTRICDAYARIFAPRSLLRRKLALLLAILESSPGVYRRVEAIDAAGRSVLLARLGGHLALWLLALVAGTLVLLPLHGLSRLRRRRPGEGASGPRNPPGGG